MSNVIDFPGKDQRQWAGVAEELRPFLASLGATKDEIPGLLDRLQRRWEQLGAPINIQIRHSIPGPLTDEQGAAFEAALREQATYISQKWKEEGTRTLFEFARLECQLARAR